MLLEGLGSCFLAGFWQGPFSALRGHMHSVAPGPLCVESQQWWVESLSHFESLFFKSASFLLPTFLPHLLRSSAFLFFLLRARVIT